MIYLRLLMAAFGFLLMGFGLSAPAQAQATRTWVSGVGDDANPCSRTAPCKTFAGAISKTSAPGEIDCLDPGEFGALTITKAITIDCEGVIGGVLVAGTNGITVAAGSTDKVVLRGLDFEGLGLGLDGIEFTSGATLVLDDVQIRNFTGNGVRVTSSAASALYVSHAQILNNTKAGVAIAPSASANIYATIDSSNLDNNGTGLTVNGAASAGALRVTLHASTAAGNTGMGVNAAGGSGSLVLVVKDSSVVNNNVGLASSAAAQIAVSRSVISGNQTGLSATGGSLLTYGNNELTGNTTAQGAFTGTLTAQ